MRPTKALTIAFFAAMAVIVFMTFRDYGISWDEELHVPYGQKLLAYYTSGFADRSAFSYINLFQYGGFFDLVSAIASSISPFGTYETRHLIGGLFFLAGLFGGWKLTRLIAGDRAAVIAALCLATTPLLFGHSFINPKDAPLAWLGVWVAYFTCRALGEGPVPWRTVAGLGISLGLSLGTRIIAFAFVAQIGALLAVRTLAEFDPARPWWQSIKRAWHLARPLVLALPLALLIMAVTWPWSVQDPLNIPSVFLNSANQFWHPLMLWCGEVISAADLPRGYLLALLAVQLPEYVLLGVGILFVIACWRVSSWRRATFAGPASLHYFYVAATVIVPLAAFALLRPSTYNGVRHFLFLVPQLVILGAIGLDRAVDFLRERKPAYAAIFAAVLAAGVLHQAIVMARIHPYQYLGFNALAGGLPGAYGRFELDYWGLSYGEAARGLARYLEGERAAGRPVPDRITLFVCGANTSAAYYLPESISITEDRLHADFFLGGDLTNPRCPQRPDGPVVVEVKRDGTVLSYVLDLRGARP